MEQGKEFKRGDLVSIRDTKPRDSMYEEMGMFNRIRLHGSVGIVLHWAGEEGNDNRGIIQHCYKVYVKNKVETVHTKYMKNVDNIILG